MRLSFQLFGREVFAVTVDGDATTTVPEEHDNTAAQVETAYDQRIGFHPSPIPSLIPGGTVTDPVPPPDLLAALQASIDRRTAQTPTEEV